MRAIYLLDTKRELLEYETLEDALIIRLLLGGKITRVNVCDIWESALMNYLNGKIEKVGILWGRTLYCDKTKHDYFMISDTRYNTFL